MTILKPGQIEFYANWVPPLREGRYKLKVEQTVSVSTATDTFISKFAFAVGGPRFSLNPSEIHSVFPHPKAQGRFTKFLPQIIFTRRSLPWERALKAPVNHPGDADMDRAWFALLLIDQNQMAKLPQPKRVNLYDKNNPANSLIGPPKGTFGPTIALSDLAPLYPQNESCQAVDIPAELFAEIVPSWDDLPFLSHARAIDTTLKESGQVSKADLDEHSTIGWYGASIGSRFPTERVTNAVYLVSLEGFEKVLYGQAANGTLARDYQTVRLACLHSWQFFDQKQSATFSELMKRVSVNTFNLSLSPPSGGKPPPRQQAVQAALNGGYTALGHTTRVGEDTVSWYRGPFVPLALQADAPIDPANPANPPIYSGPDAALRYNPDTGLFDVTYASAWQLGQLLALQNRHFAIALYNWRQQNQRQAMALARRLKTWNRLNQSLNLPENMDVLLNNERFHQHMLRQLAGSLAGNIARINDPDASHGENTPVNTEITSGDHCLTDRFHQILKQQPELWAGLLQTKGEDPPEVLTKWLARLKLLYGVPFAYLVPDARMLPMESIRFFQVDGNWIDALCDGALSIGRKTQLDVSHDQGMSPLLHQASDKHVPEVRAALWQGVAVQKPASVPTKYSGFLMRSVVVAQYPGLEVKVFAEGDTEPLSIVRLERLGNELMLCIVAGSFAKIELKQPGEGLQFGADFDDSGATYHKESLRYLGYGKQAPGTEIKNLKNVPVEMRNSQLHLMDTARMASSLSKLLTSNGFNAAEFAVEMVEGAGEQIYRTSNPSPKQDSMMETNAEEGKTTRQNSRDSLNSQIFGGQR